MKKSEVDGYQENKVRKQRPFKGPLFKSRVNDRKVRAKGQNLPYQISGGKKINSLNKLLITRNK
jgi:hypothetical protein